MSTSDAILLFLLGIWIGWILGTVQESNWWLVNPGIYWKLQGIERREVDNE